MTDLAERQAPPALAGAPSEPGALRALGQRAQTATGVGVRPGRAWTVARVSLDASMLFIAAAATTLGSSAAGLPAPPPIWLAAYSVFVLGFAALRGLYGTRLRYELLEELRAVLVAASLATVPLLLLRGLASDPGRPVAAGDPRLGLRSRLSRRRPRRAPLVTHAGVPPRRIVPSDADHRRRQGRQAHRRTGSCRSPSSGSSRSASWTRTRWSSPTSLCRSRSSAPAGTSTGSCRSTASSR